MTPEQRQLLARLIADDRVRVDYWPELPSSTMGPAVDLFAVHDRPDGARAVLFLSGRSIYLPVGPQPGTPRAELIALAVRAIGHEDVCRIQDTLNRFDRIVREVSP